MITLFDVILLATMLISAFFAMSRGLIREVLSLAAWAGAFAAAGFVVLYPEYVIVHVEQYVTPQLVAIIASALIAFFAALFILHFITIKLSNAILEGIAGPIDRSLGFIFGAARGFLLIAFLMALFWQLIPETSTSMPDWITNAKSKLLVKMASDEIISLLPQNWEDVLRSFTSNSDVQPDTQQGTTQQDS